MNLPYLRSNDLTELTPEQESILQLWLQRELAGQPDQDPAAIRRVPREGNTPLSFAQARLWFLEQLEPGKAAYNIPAAVRLSGKLNVAALEQTFRPIVQRHETLRTRLEVVDGEPAQVISEYAGPDVPVIDLTKVSGGVREQLARRLIAEDAGRSFDLAREAPIRVGLLRLNKEEHILLIVMHHILSDAWSMGILVRELAAVYRALNAGRSDELEELIIQYADYAVWQRDKSGEGAFDNQVRYWRSQLDGVEILELPTDRARPRVPTFAGATHSFALPADLSERLKDLADRQHCTMFMLGAAAFNLLLHRYSHNEHIAVGAPIAGRSLQELEPLIGFFVNTLVLYTDHGGAPSFLELLARVRQVTLEAYENQDVPFERLVEELQPDRSSSHNPLFQVAFTSQNATREAIQIRGLNLRFLEQENDLSKFDLTLGLAEIAGGLLATVEYSRELFDASTVDRMMRHFVTLLENIAAEPEQRICSIPMLTSGERQQLLLEWNQTKREFEDTQCVHRLVERYAEIAPDAVAVVSGDLQVTYRELNARANKLAHYLRLVGVELEAKVGVLMDRSAGFVVALLAIIKAGGAYIPLDRECPEARLKEMTEDARMTAVVTDTRTGYRLTGANEADVPELDENDERLGLGRKTILRVVHLDEEEQEIGQQSVENPNIEVDGRNLAYVIYTSGSTGRPKGVEVEHDGLGNLIRWHQGEYGISREDRATLLAAVTFDASVWELWPYLTAGSCICVPDESTRRQPDKLAGWLAENQITISFLPTPLAEAVLEEPSARELQLRYLLTGGDVLHIGPPKNAGFTLVNHYGPTENTVVATAIAVGTGNEPHQVPPIGYPIANTEVYILDEMLEPSGIGISGEIYIAGNGLARGYLKRPDGTAEKFIPNPHGGRRGERLYRTGDLGKYQPNGAIEFVGRIDQQVKVRGCRIELKEIEAVLMRHSSVREAVVVAAEDERGQKQLEAYVAPAKERNVTAAELKRHLKDNLPPYMIPAIIEIKDELPKTAHGKVDRKTISADKRKGTKVRGSYAVARTPIEEIVAGVYAQDLGLQELGMEDNFFELGGHSLLATRIATKLRDAFHLDVPLRLLFEEPTVRGLSIEIEKSLKGGSAVQRQAISATPRENRMAVSLAQQRLWFLEQFEPGKAVYNIPAAVRLTGELNIPALNQTFEQLTARHEVLRTRFEVVEGQPMQVITAALIPDLPLVALSGFDEASREEKARLLVEEEISRGFDLEAGAPWRVRLLKLSDTNHIIVIVMHHIVSDGWSAELLVRELSVLYGGYVRGEETALKPLEIQYADYAAWQRDQMQGRKLDGQLKYWTRQLEGLEALELPTDRVRPPTQTFAGATHTLVVPPELNVSLRELSRRKGVTIFMTLLAGFAVLLHRYSGQDDIVIGTGIANRTRYETEQLLGCFFNLLALRTDLSESPTFSRLLERVRQVTLEAYTHQDVPFESLIEVLQPERTSRRTPLFQVALVFQNLSGRILELPGLKLSLLSLSAPVAKFDLTLLVGAGDESLIAALEYRTDLFEASTIGRMGRHFLTLLSNIADNPDQEITKIEMSAEEEKQQLVSAFDDDLGEF